MPPRAAEEPPPLEGLDQGPPWILALGDASLGRARAAFFAGLPLGPELDQSCLRHRFVVPAIDPEALNASLLAWWESAGAREGLLSVELETGDTWVRVELTHGSNCVWDAVEEQESGAMDLLRAGHGALARPGRRNQLNGVAGLAAMRREVDGLSPEERMPVAFARHGALLAASLEGHGDWDGAGQNCLRRFLERLVETSPTERGQVAAWARQELDCMDADPATRELAGQMRWLRLRYRAQRPALLVRWAEGLAMLKRACEEGTVPACSRALDWQGRAEPELARVAKGLGQAQMAYGLQRRLLVDRAGRLTGEQGMKASEGFQLWIDAQAPWKGLGAKLEELAGLGRVPRLKVALRDVAGELRLFSLWLDDKPSERAEGLGGLARLGQGRKPVKTRTRVGLELDGMALSIQGPGGRLRLPAPAGCERVECWNLEGLKRVLQDERIARIDPLFLLRASGSSRWEQVSALLVLMKELDSEVLVDPRPL